MSHNNAQTHGKLQSCQTLRGDMQIAVETTQTYDLNNLPQHNLTGQLHVKFLIIAQHEAQRQKKSNVPTENGKCTNVANRVSQSTPF